MGKPLLEIKNLQVDFETEIGRSTAIKDCSFTVNRGEIVAIVGESGSGKTVSALSVLRLLPAKTVRYPRGEIIFSEDENTSINLLEQDTAALRNIRGNKIAMIFQEPMTSLNPVFTCGHQVMEALLTHKKISHKQAKQDTLTLFEKVKLPDPSLLFHRYPHQLSGGQKQRVMIALAMCCNPDLLICDEPTTALDVTVQKNILGLLKELQSATQMGVIFITHDLGVVNEIADRAVVMYKGAIVETGKVSDLFKQPSHPYTRGLLACRPALHPKGKRLPVVSDFLNNPGLHLHYTDNNKSETISTSPAESKVLLEAIGLSVQFPGQKNFLGKTLTHFKAVDEVSFQLFEKETLGLVGESGCGKTTLGRTLLRLIEPSSGKLLYKEENLLAKTATQLKSLRKEIQIVFQDPYSSLNPRLTIEQALTEPMLVHGIGKNRQQRKDQVVALLEKVDLRPEHLDRYPHEFSGGQRQRIVIARALSLQPSFIVCDESVSALDVSVQAQVLNLLNDLKKEFGFSILFISHDLSVVHYISDRIMVMNKGKIEEIGSASQVYRFPQSPYTQQLIDSIPLLKNSQSL